LNVPGLKVVAPSCPKYAKALLKAAIRDEDPVVFIEQKKFYNMEGFVGDDQDLMTIGKAMVEKGTDITLISYGFLSEECRKVREALLLEDIHCEVVDLCSLKPLDKNAILQSVCKTGRVITVQEAPKAFGVGSEISRIISEDDRAFAKLKKPIVQLGGKEMPIPFSKTLEKAYSPDREMIKKAVIRMMKNA